MKQQQQQQQRQQQQQQQNWTASFPQNLALMQIALRFQAFEGRSPASTGKVRLTVWYTVKQSQSNANIS